MTVVSELLPSGMPPGRALELPDRGTTWIHEAGQDQSGVAVMLLHGWTATAELNWFTSMATLAEHHHVVAIEHRGHGRGIRADGRFTLADCADDAAAAADALGIDQFVAVGYSMGGPIAQLCWHRHADRTAGLVLCATAARFSAGAGTGAIATGLNGLATLSRRLPDERRAALTQRVLNPKYSPDDPGGRIGLAAADSHELAHLVEALAELTAYRAPWLNDIDVPTAVVLTSQDRVVDPERQRDLHRRIAGASLHVVDGDHTVCASHPELFVPALVGAVNRVTRA